jgi:hypothetical protein
MPKTNIPKLISNSPWRNVYWFSRMLLSGDKYGGIGKSKMKHLLLLCLQLEAIISAKNLSEAEKISVCRKTLEDTISTFYNPNSKGFVLSQVFVEDVCSELNSIADVVAFIVSVQFVVDPMNAAMGRIPSSDTEFCRGTAESILKTLGEGSVGKVISTWDDLGVRGCIDVERSVVVSEFTKLRANIAALNEPRSELDDNIILTAFVQEFERRLGQKRKNRAGNSLEDVSDFLFEYYGLSSHPGPDHFQTDIEVDKWFKCKDGWIIGISCKRTLRERWKQVSSADGNTLSKYKIKEIWHLITYDQDLSDEKLTMLGGQRQIFYLDDSKERFKSARNHIGMRDYVRPLSRLIEDIRKEQRGT